MDWTYTKTGQDNTEPQIWTGHTLQDYTEPQTWTAETHTKILIKTGQLFIIKKILFGGETWPGTAVSGPSTTSSRA